MVEVCYYFARINKVIQTSDQNSLYLFVERIIMLNIQLFFSLFSFQKNEELRIVSIERNHKTFSRHFFYTCERQYLLYLFSFSFYRHALRYGVRRERKRASKRVKILCRLEIILKNYEQSSLFFIV